MQCNIPASPSWFMAAQKIYNCGQQDCGFSALGHFKSKRFLPKDQRKLCAKREIFIAPRACQGISACIPGQKQPAQKIAAEIEFAPLTAANF